MEGIVGNFFAGTQGVNASFFPAREQEPEIDVVLSTRDHAGAER
jgi:hypothetical protein